MLFLSFPEQIKCLSKEAEITYQAQHSKYVPEAELFHRIFPFHVVLDEELRVLQLGTGLGRMLPSLALGAKIQDHLEASG